MWKAWQKWSKFLNTSTNPSPLPEAFLSCLNNNLPAQAILTDPADCWAYGYDNSRHHALPQIVVFPVTHKQVVYTVNACNQYDISLVVRGRGTGTTGATVPVTNGLVMSMERMTQIIEFSPDNRYITVEPGVTNQQVQDAVEKKGFFWPPDPTSAAFCTVGGNLAYNSAGPRAVKYGTPRENTLALKAVTGDGKEIQTGVYTTKGVVGYDLTRLLLGSEGTLAIITQATLKLAPLAETTKTLRAIYAGIHDAAAAVAAIMAQPVTPCALEFIDGTAINMIRQYSSCKLAEKAGALLMIAVDGTEAGIDYAVQKVAKAAANKGLLDLQIAQTDAEVAALWQARKALSPALRKVAPQKINEDVAVPVTNIPALIGGLEQLSKQYQIPIVNFGHAGNGNIHVNLLFNPDIPGESERVHRCLDEVFSLTLKLNGTLSGEHGVGLVKRDFIEREIDPNTLALMRKIKKQFDPNGILNPEKMFPLN
jgi:glycolate oxidase subunit GlcD